MTEFFGGGSGGGSDDLLDRFFGGGGGQQGNRQRQQRPREQETQAAGTGFVINKTLGYILTNNHVVEGATKVEVNFLGEEGDVYHEARIVGRDPLSDSALLQLVEKKSDLTEVKFGDSAQMQPGDWVMAIGNPFQLGHTVTVGVISALGRPLGGVPQREQPMLQTDAAINPGNSGGPLLNIRGEVIGMNTAIYTDQRSANIGIGFATPINAVRDLLPQLRNGKVVRGVIGVQVSRDHLTSETARAFGLPNNSGALISAVNANGPADKAGLQPGDVIVEFNGKPVKDSDSLVAMVVGTKPGTSVPVTIYRNNQRKQLNLTIDELDLEAEQGRSARRNDSGAEQPATTGFGMTLDPITPDVARRLDLPSNQGAAIVSDVDRDSAAGNAGIAPGDVILEVNRQKVSTVSQVTRELQKVPAGTPAFVLVWRDGQQVFVTMTKR
jgi:serine protease Do